MKAWNIDANTINTGDIQANDLNNLMVVTREIKDFLSPDTKKMFIVAPKGVGKTFLLKVKSQLFRDKYSGYKFIPEETLCESFTSNDISFSESELTKFAERGAWNKMWELCLYSLILRQFKSNDIPKEILNVIGEDTGALNEILGAFLHVRSKIEKLHGLVPLKLKPAVRKLRDNSTANQIAIFIDNIDESFDSYVGFTAQSEGKLKASSIWINAQLSLLSVARDICQSNHHIKIFSTIRSEAYNNFFDPIKLQIDERCVFLSYTKNEIREIFIKNIRLTSKEDLISFGNQDPLMDLFGDDHIPHKFVEDDFGKKKTENIFDFVYRHTYARPRDIVLMGKSIVEKIPPQVRHKSNEIANIINEQSYKLFEQLKNETIPVFEEEIFERFCLRIKSNVIKYEEAYKIFQEFKNEGFNNVFSYFYRLGLIGIVESNLTNAGGDLKQSFLPVGQYSLTNDTIPEYQYFVLHPSLNKKMKQIHDVGFYDRFNIIGYDYPFNAQKINTLENHFHFGLDRDSITTILPALQSTKCIAVLVNPAAEWNGLEKSKTLTVSINAVDFSFRVYRENLSEKEKNEIKSDWKEKKYHVVVYSNYIEEVSFFFEKSVTSSLCLFLPHADMIDKLLSEADIRNHHHIYFCTRDFSKIDFEYFESRIREKAESLSPELLLHDRFQFSFDIQHNIEEQVFRCLINAENYYSIVCKNRPNTIFKYADKITHLYSDEEFDFYKRRQNFLVEGIYYFLKVLASHGLDRRKQYEGVIEKFIVLQSIRVSLIYSDSQIVNLFQGKTRDVLTKELVKFGGDTLIRIEHLYKSGLLMGSTNDLSSNKEKLIFPSEKEFFDHIRMIPNFYNISKDFLQLKRLLEYKPLDNYRKLFISYSSKDSKIAQNISDRLELLGVDVRIYEQDNPVSFNKVYMHTVIGELDRMMFVASRNSLSSDACHFELTQCIEYIRKTNDSDRLIVIRLDEYVHEANVHGIVDAQRVKNIIFLRDNTSIRNFPNVDSTSFRILDEWLIDICNKSLLINPASKKVSKNGSNRKLVS